MRGDSNARLTILSEAEKTLTVEPLSAKEYYTQRREIVALFGYLDDSVQHRRFADDEIKTSHRLSWGDSCLPPGKSPPAAPVRAAGGA
ncbi:MAG: hypothetical protein ACYCWC_13715 [Rhodocyclaceae bacterium]